MWIFLYVLFPYAIEAYNFKSLNFFHIFFGGLECVGHSFAYVAHLWFLRDVWIQTKSAAVASGHATNLVTHL